ncbi:Nif11-like leader peptide family natural product precursor [Spirulina sp. 06S082]|uniref:Nif11-like leader peptide family natural product precursor n=1 Tax=Spirulina sp. 06S082 TaxID=3110248 RepID=UPI002B201697|nr:Nif11-like leader peptide family natural product precursor [Spirulina sp. 06S082]MEA5468874.1 Nif11-like leader peptide family natural product precursor [Spirulina sp. 06S082]
MSKDNVLQFLTKAANNQQLQEKLALKLHPDELAALGKEEGFEFSADDVMAALTHLQKQPGFFKKLAEAAARTFSPAPDDYPATGVQPFSGRKK